MNFDFSEEQKELAEHARKFLSESCTFDRLRRYMEGDEDFDRELWQQMVELGWTGINIPEAHGGLEMGVLELCLLSREVGRVLAPVPFAGTVCLGPDIITRLGGTVAVEYLPRIAQGELIVAVALAGEHNELRYREGAVSGDLRPVAWLAAADILITTAKDVDAEDVLVLVDLDQDSVSRLPLGEAQLDGLVRQGAAKMDTTPVEVLARGAQARELQQYTLARAAVLTAFEQVGGAETCCEMARDYSLERYTFGRAIGSYQAVKHKLADVQVEIELALSNAYYGAWALSTEAEDLTRAAAVARISATEASVMAAEENLQVHGGIGYTWEANCHFFYQRARLLAINYGNADYWSAQLLATL